MAEALDLTPLEPANDDNRSETASESDSTGSSLASLRSSIREHRRENGRRYHSLSDGTYVLPNDEQEQERLELSHRVWELTWQGDLCRCPKNKSAERVLDLGTGTGIWAIEFADDHPEATVIGVDLSPIQPGYVPANCSFEIDDIEKEWTWTIPFDFIFVRQMNSCFASWEKMLKQAYDNLEPGGYIELVDNSFPLDCQDGTLAPDSALTRWSSLLMEACAKMGRPVTVPARFAQLLRDAGFEAVVEERRVWPLHEWPRDPHLRELGYWVYYNGLESVEASALALFTRVLGWTREEVLVFCAEVRRELKEKKAHAFWNIYCAYGRKPLKEQTPAEEQTPAA
ncbi:methyltransferase domain-containing protein [Colletotrichum asianum]|uniref:Methyltransferase domain-containing protein n=1 Tax=Colletotrichum asianum TaxID=702518 RepID=A0A8H3ZTF7_9PEZI|nr:methyltransferase domain-containing protein [Colletotrichum asianum]